MPTLDATYRHYCWEYGGDAVEEAEWDGYAAKAAAYLARLDALGKVTPYGDPKLSWRNAQCAVAEQYRNFDVAANGAGGSGPVASASIGSVSVSYDNTFGGSIDLTPAGRERALLDSVRPYLHVYLGAAQWWR